MNRLLPTRSSGTARPATIRLTLVLSLLASVMAVPSATLAQGRDSGIQCGPSVLDPAKVIINKDLGDERYAITFDLTTSEAIGNVYAGDGSVTVLMCQASDPGAWVNGEDPIAFDCLGADGCTEDGCPPYNDAGAPSIARSFFEAPCSPDAVGRDDADLQENYTDWSGLPAPLVSEDMCREGGATCEVWAYKNTEDASSRNNAGYCIQQRCR